MSRIINVFELSGHQQDVLWSNHCPYCLASIIETEKTENDAYWYCHRCDIRVVCE